MKLSAYGYKRKSDDATILYIKELHTFIKTGIKQEGRIALYENLEFPDDVINNGKEALANYAREMELRELKKIPSISFCILTNKCNMSCSFCYADKNSDMNERPFDVQNVLKLKEILPPESFSDIVFTGGEPLLLWDTVKELRPLFNKATLYTNGALMDEEKAQWCIDTNTGLYISMDYEIENFDGHDSVGVRKLIDSLIEKFPALKDLIEVSVVFPIDGLCHLNQLRGQDSETKKTMKHEFNFVREDSSCANCGGHAPKDEDIPDEVLMREVDKIENGEITMEQSLFKKFINTASKVLEDYMLVISCDPTISINYNGNIFMCHAHGSSDNTDVFEDGLGWTLEDFTLAKYFKAVADKRLRFKSDVCDKSTCMAEHFCGGVCWANNKYNPHNCVIYKKFLIYSLYLMINNIDVPIEEIININNLKPTEEISYKKTN